MERHPNNLTTDEEIDAAIEEANHSPEEPVIVEATYFPGSRLDFLELKLSDGTRLLIPREELSELRNATPEQATDLVIVPSGTGVWWPQIDDGLYLPDFLEHRWRKSQREQIPVAA